MGAGVILIYMLALLEASTTFIIINLLGTSGFFILYGVFTVCSIIFTYFFVGETKGLTEKQRK